MNETVHHSIYPRSSDGICQFFLNVKAKMMGNDRKVYEKIKTEEIKIEQRDKTNTEEASQLLESQ